MTNAASSRTTAPRWSCIPGMNHDVAAMRTSAIVRVSRERVQRRGAPSSSAVPAGGPIRYRCGRFRALERGALPSASGATHGRPFGAPLEHLGAGDVDRHWPGKTITEYDDHL